MTIHRRHFLAMSGAAAGLSLTSLPFGLLPNADAQAGPRSLVCVLLFGGADSFNMYMPRAHGVPDQDYTTYRTTRGVFAVDADQMLPIGDGDFGLHPILTNLQRISQANDLAVVRNVGPLSRPTTKADYLNKIGVPQSLFAHDAQRKLWQTGQTTTISDNGWGGSIAAAVATGGLVPPSFSIDGSNAWQASVSSAYSTLSPTVAIERLAGYDPNIWNWNRSLSGISPVLNGAIDDALNSPHLLEQAAGRAIRRSIITTDTLRGATADSAENEVGMDDIGRNDLGLQLEQVARLIKNRENLGMDRQIFFAQMGGWDTHGEQASRLPVLLGELNVALGSFYDAMQRLGIGDSVTTFTASDFGRTLTINGDGTDHGWGGNAFVMGGAVTGGDYGTFPSLALENNPDDVGENSRDFGGRLIPTTSVAQYGATLSRWMGLSEAQLNAALPPLQQFANRDLGFMSA